MNFTVHWLLVMLIIGILNNSRDNGSAVLNAFLVVTKAFDKAKQNHLFCNLIQHQMYISVADSDWHGQVSQCSYEFD